MEAFQRFEQEWAKWAGVDNVVGCSSGTAALHLALEALQLPQGSKVIVPDFTMIACARAVTLAGLTPVFASVTHEGLLDPDMIDWIAQVKDGVSAVMAVHVYGRSCNMPMIHDLASKYNLKVIEDLAEAHCTTPHPNTHASCWSFYKNKLVFGEEGGAVAFRYDLPELTTLTRCLRSLGDTPHHNYTHIPRGHNYRLSNLHAEEIRNNLSNVGTWIKMRREQEAVYEDRRPYHLVSVLPSPRGTPWVYDILVSGMSSGQQKRIIQKMWDYSIPARYGFYPMTMQEEYKDWQGDEETTAMRLAHEVICLPLGQSIKNDVKYTARVAFDVIEQVMSQPASSS